MGVPIISSSELGWAAYNLGKTLPRGSAASARPSVYYPPPQIPPRASLQMPPILPNGMWFACLIVECGCPWPGGSGYQTKYFCRIFLNSLQPYPRNLTICLIIVCLILSGSQKNREIMVKNIPIAFLLFFFTSPPSELISPPSLLSPPPSSLGATASFAEEILLVVILFYWWEIVIL